jgi:hypothetical protein
MTETEQTEFQQIIKAASEKNLLAAMAPKAVRQLSAEEKALYYKAQTAIAFFRLASGWFWRYQQPRSQHGPEWEAGLCGKSCKTVGLKMEALTEAEKQRRTFNAELTYHARQGILESHLAKLDKRIEETHEQLFDDHSTGSAELSNIEASRSN